MSIASNNPGDNTRTIVAVVLSVIVITIGFWIQNQYFPSAAQRSVSSSSASVSSTNTQAAATASPVAAAAPSASAFVSADKPTTKATTDTTSKSRAAEPNSPVAEQTFQIETDLVLATLTNRGGELLSLKLKKHKDKDGFVDLFVPGTQDTRGMAVAFGGPSAPPLRELMNQRRIDERTIEFSRQLYVSVPGSDPLPITYKRTFQFHNGEYLFGLAVTLENSVNAALPLNQDGFAYTLSFGPRIGPSIQDMGQNTDIRSIITFSGGKAKKEGQKNQPWSPATQPTWSAISGKYFSFIAVPQLASFSTQYTETTASPNQITALAFSRPAIAASAQTDLWYFYFGPKTNVDLGKYEYKDRNGFGLQGMSLESAIDNSTWLKWLEDILKAMMNLFYKIIPNYGVSIMLVTLLVKLVFFPLTRSGSMASARMQELQPKMVELQAKYKGNPQKLNVEMAEFYKREGYNPMSGCLPLLIQLPLFFAMYNLFNTHFDLRGASFIPGWIPDLSQPESVWHFGGFTIPLLNWTDLRLLPIIYVGSQLLYGKFTQMPQTGGSAAQMKIMMYGMPIFFFFILYNVPSGMLVYWIVQNVLTIIQQIIINDYIKTHKAKLAAAKLGK